VLGGLLKKPEHILQRFIQRFKIEIIDHLSNMIFIMHQTRSLGCHETKNVANLIKIRPNLGSR
jgi:hypothetical protein